MQSMNPYHALSAAEYFQDMRCRDQLNRPELLEIVWHNGGCEDGEHTHGSLPFIREIVSDRQ